MVTFVNPTFIIVNNGARAIRRVTSSIQKISKIVPRGQSPRAGTAENNRTVYRDPETGKIYAFDTQHGRFEVLDKNGNHIDEVNIDGKAMGKKDKSGGHNIYTK